MKKLAFFTLLLSISCTLHAQRYVEIGGFIGVANYQGDLSQDPIEFGATKFSVGGLVRYHYSNKLYFKGNVYAGQISGNDANADPESTLFERGWSMTANLLEVSINAEWLPLAKPRFNDVGIFRPQINPYLFVGIGSNFLDKELEFGDNPPPGRFGQVAYPELEDTNNFLIVPIGGGLRFDFTQWSTLGFEWGWRYTNTDYIDGISLNGKAAGPDWYFFWGVTLSTYFGEQEDFGL